MKWIWLFATVMLSSAPMAVADTHTDAARAFVKATALEETFAITRAAILKQLNDLRHDLQHAPDIRADKGAKTLTEEFIANAEAIANESLGWDANQAKYVEAVKATYSEEELKEINAFLSTKYGKTFIAGQRDFMLKTIEINASAIKDYNQRVSPVQQEYISAMTRLRTNTEKGSARGKE